MPTKELCAVLTRISSSSLTWMAALSRFWEFWIKDHQEGDDGRTGVDDELPRIGIVKNRPR